MLVRLSHPAHLLSLLQLQISVPVVLHADMLPKAFSFFLPKVVFSCCCRQNHLNKNMALQWQATADKSGHPQAWS